MYTLYIYICTTILIHEGIFSLADHTYIFPLVMLDPSKDTAIFAVRQLAWPLIYLHVLIAYIFFAHTRGRIPISAFQRKLPQAIAILLLVTGASITFESLAFKGVLPCNPLFVEVVLVGLCVLFVGWAYLKTCIILAQRTRGQFVGRESSHVLKARNLTIAKLLIILISFILVWSLAVSNNIRFLSEKIFAAEDVPSAIMSILDSVILGNLFHSTR